MKFSISVVIPNYNGKHLLESNIPFVYAALRSSGITDFEIIVSDDASHDDSVDFLKSNYPAIILIENKINKGFSGNMNVGIFRSTKDLVLLLNSDVVLTAGYFKNQLHYFKKSDTFGVM
jgi:GT2 family glycosyltransferase